MEEQAVITRVEIKEKSIFQSLTMILLTLFLAALFQITVLNRLSRIEKGLDNMRNTCFVIAEKGKP
jgi:hypothetical protein